MLKVKAGRKDRRLGLLVLCFAVCFLVGLGGILLSRGYGPAALVRVWPWGPGAGNGGGYGKIIIQPGQVLRVPRPVGAPAPQPVEIPVPPVTVSRIPAGQKVVALTFDAGWEYKPTRPLLEVLRSYDLRVTFFPRAKWLEDNPELALEILADGHEIGSHSYTHPYVDKLDASRMDYEIARAKQALIDVCGPDAFIPLYRPPYGSHSSAVNEVLSRHGYGWVLMWQVDSLDWKEPGVDAIAQRVLDRVTDGGVVLMHVGTMQTVEALPRIIDTLTERGLRVVRVSELLGLDFGPVPDYDTYTVKPGDTVYAIAAAHHTTVETILDLNPDIRPH